MNHYENSQMGPWMNMPGTLYPWMAAPGAEQFPYYKPDVTPVLSGANAYPLMYPEIYYRIHPIVNRITEEENMRGMPTQEQAERMIDRAYDEVCRTYPDLAEYAREYEMKVQQNDNDVEATQFYPGYWGFYGDPYARYGYGFRFSRGRLLRDLTGILLISTLLRPRFGFGY